MFLLGFTYRFLNNIRKTRVLSHHLRVEGIQLALIEISATDQFKKRMKSFKNGCILPFLAPSRVYILYGIIFVRERLIHSNFIYGECYPIILNHKAHLLWTSAFEACAGPILQIGLVLQNLHFIGTQKIVRKVSWICITYRKGVHQKIQLTDKRPTICYYDHC